MAHNLKQSVNIIILGTFIIYYIFVLKFMEIPKVGSFFLRKGCNENTLMKGVNVNDKYCKYQQLN
jgi:hypothetical protein